MFRVSITFVVLALVSVLMMGSTFKEQSSINSKNQSSSVVAEAPVKKACTGFTVIEASKGINCYGDTVRLVKRGGIYELAAVVNRTKTSSISGSSVGS